MSKKAVMLAAMAIVEFYDKRVARSGEPKDEYVSPFTNATEPNAMMVDVRLMKALKVAVDAEVRK